MGFGRACAPVRCAHPSFWALCHAQRGAARPLAHGSFAAPPKIKKLNTSRNKMSFRPKLAGRQGHIFFHWAKLHPTELRCFLLSYNARSRATLHPNELRCTLLSYAAFKWAMLHPIWASLHPKSYATPSKLSCTLLSCAAPFWAKLHSTWAMRHPKKYNLHHPSQLHVFKFEYRKWKRGTGAAVSVS